MCTCEIENKKMRSFADEKPPNQLKALPEHFDYIDAVQMGEYYDKGIIVQLLFEKTLSLENPEQVFSSLMERQMLRTDTTKVTVLCPLFSLEIPSGNYKFSTIREFLKSIMDSIEEMPSSVRQSLEPKIVIFKEIASNVSVSSITGVVTRSKKSFVPDWFKLVLEDPLGNSRIQTPVDISQDLSFEECYNKDAYLQCEIFCRTEDECSEFDLDIGQDQGMTGTLYGEQAFEKIVSLLKSCKKILGLTGAGVSVESNISTFKNTISNQIQ